MYARSSHLRALLVIHGYDSFGPTSARRVPDRLDRQLVCSFEPASATATIASDSAGAPPLRLLSLAVVVALASILPSVSAVAGQGLAASIILNEYNAVSAGNFLNGGDEIADTDGGTAADSRLGRVLGNGGDWFELVIVEEGLDLRGYRFEIYDAGAVFPDVTLILSQDPLFQGLRAGTILTVAEEQPTDASYDPDGGDWWIQLEATAGGDPTYISQAAFDVSNNDWQLRILDPSGVPVFGRGGEGVSPPSGIGSTEVFRLQEDPSIAIDESSPCYDDGSRASSFGEPNSWGEPLKTQRFDALRAGLPPTSQCNDADISDFAFDPDRLLEIEITMAPDDWDFIRTQSRGLLDTLGGRCDQRPPPNPFVFRPGDITIDGETIGNVGIRKKGFFGSIDRGKPSLKVDFSEFTPDQSWSSLERLTLNNSKQDPSLVDQCLGYSLFRAAGLPASRCNFAHVSVNGQDLGIFVHVESIKDPFLARNFGNAAGNLYEGAVSDFRDGYIRTFEAKNGGDGSDLDAFAQAMESSDEELLANLAPFFDLDDFVTYWAMEGLVGHWDGYSGNSNNFWIYNDPATGFQFIPWSLDDIFGRGNPFSDTGPDLAIAPSVADRSQLVYRLWGLPAVQTAYGIRIQELLDEVWDEAALLAEIDRMEALISPVAGDLSAELNETRAWISDRANHIDDDFGASPPAQLGEPLAERFCLQTAGTFHIEFSGEWDNLAVPNPLGEGVVDFSATLDPPFEPNTVGFVSGPSDVLPDENPTLRFLPAFFNPFTLFALNIDVHPEQYVTGVPIALDDNIANVLSFIDFSSGVPIPITAGQLPDITMTLTEVSTTPGGPVSGVIDGKFAFFVPAPEPTARPLAACALAALAGLSRSRRRRS